MSRAPVIPDVCARRKYVSWRGRVVVTPERMTKKIITMDPARKIRATPPSDGSVRDVSIVLHCLWIAGGVDSRPAMAASDTRAVESATGRKAAYGLVV